MKTGLAIGMFMPLHKGHLALIDFAKERCHHLIVLLCYSEKEPIDGSLRQQWLEESFKHDSHITIQPFLYDENELPNTSVSSMEVSKVWANKLKALLPQVDVVFSSEDYGNYLAGYMNIQHILFDKERVQQNISATSIRQNPFRYWDFIAKPAQPFFVQKVVLLGTESTGKSMLTKRLAQYFQTAFVKEMASDVIEHTEECTEQHLEQIAALHAQAILKQLQVANRLLFIDTDLSITQSYSLFLFNKPLHVAQWMEDANKAHLYFFLEPDCPFVQDGTRLAEVERNKLSNHHKSVLEQKGIPYTSITGNWDNRFETIKGIVEEHFYH